MSVLNHLDSWVKKSLQSLLIMSLIHFGCQTEKKIEEEEQYLRLVGDIEQSNELDDSNFKTCNRDEKIFQYFNLEKGPKYIGEKSTLLKVFDTKYNPISDKTQNGLIRIRFVVNCQGKAGRFRVLQSDYDYKEIEFDKEIVDQLTEITKVIGDWEILFYNEIPVDYYFYLIFKISEGQLIEILP